MATREVTAARSARGLAPVLWRIAWLVAVAALLAVPLYLLAVRGEALLLDLQSLSQRVLCF
jgi:hypothetical protein